MHVSVIVYELMYAHVSVNVMCHVSSCLALNNNVITPWADTWSKEWVATWQSQRQNTFYPSRVRKINLPEPGSAMRHVK